MITKIINISLLVIFTLLSLNVSPNTPGIKKNKETASLITVPEELKENDLRFEAWMIELKEFNTNTMEFPDKDIRIEDWMTVELFCTAENKNFPDQDLIIEDWMIKISNFRNEEVVFDVELEIEPWMYTIM